MNRRGFFGMVGAAAAGFVILPSAATYARSWKPTAAGVWVPNPAYEKGLYAITFLLNPLAVNQFYFDRRLPSPWNSMETESLKPYEFRYTIENGELKPVPTHIWQTQS